MVKGTTNPIRSKQSISLVFSNMQIATNSANNLVEKLAHHCRWTRQESDIVLKKAGANRIISFFIFGAYSSENKHASFLSNVPPWSPLNNPFPDKENRSVDPRWNVSLEKQKDIRF